jgi:hypothetical protein
LATALTGNYAYNATYLSRFSCIGGDHDRAAAPCDTPRGAWGNRDDRQGAHSGSLLASFAHQWSLRSCLTTHSAPSHFKSRFRSLKFELPLPVGLKYGKSKRRTFRLPEIIDQLGFCWHRYAAIILSWLRPSRLTWRASLPPVIWVTDCNLDNFWCCPSLLSSALSATPQQAPEVGGIIVHGWK